MGDHDIEECPAIMRGRHDAELKALKEGQDRMDVSVKELTATIKEYVVLTQEIQTTRIATLEKRQDAHKVQIEQLGKDFVAIKGKTDFAYKVIMAGAAALIVGMVGVIFGFLWSNAVQHAQPEKVRSCVDLFNVFS